MPGANKLMTSGGGGVTLQPASSIATDVTMNIPSEAGTLATQNYVSQFNTFRNRLINGAMVIDQRNAGASVAISNNSVTYTLDRWLAYTITDGFVSVQQVSDAPSGFTKSLKVTVTTADSSLSSGQYACLQHRIEGYNWADLAYGTASAQTTTLSFWVKSSVTGTFGGAYTNASFDRAYPFTFTINSANTWEQKTITIAGDQSGTWDTSNSVGNRLIFGLGAASNLSASAGAWTAGTYVSATGATNFMATLNATFQITGVQLEKGSVATSFEYRPYGTELALCYRYYEQILYGVGSGSGNGMITIGQAYTTSAVQAPYTWTTTKRAAPTISPSSSSTSLYGATGSPYAATLSFSNINPQACYINATQNSGANMVAGNASLIYAGVGLYVQISAEL